MSDSVRANIWIRHTPDPSLVKNYFGGMYSASYPHPVTNAQSCPNGYTGHKIIGHLSTPAMPNTDQSAYVCILKNTDHLSSSNTIQRFNSQSAFISANSDPTIISYDTLANGRLPTYEYTFLNEGVKLKPNDPNYALPLLVGNFSTLLPGKDIAITGKE